MRRGRRTAIEIGFQIWWQERLEDGPFRQVADQVAKTLRRLLDREQARRGNGQGAVLDTGLDRAVTGQQVIQASRPDRLGHTLEMFGLAARETLLAKAWQRYQPFCRLLHRFQPD